MFIFFPAEGTRICEEALTILTQRREFPAGLRDKAIVHAIRATIYQPRPR